VVLSARRHVTESGREWQSGVLQDMQLLAAARPTAVNLFWALARMQRCLDGAGSNPVAALQDEARRIHAEDIAANLRMGEAGAALIEKDSSVLTHCNAGALATGGHGTALGVIRSAWAAGKLHQVYAGETRPWLQGARLTAWELVRDGIPVSLMADGAAAARMAAGGIGWVIVGSDRIAANGDVANKIGTYLKALAAHDNDIPFYVALPSTTIDWEARDGVREIPIEERDPEEVSHVHGVAGGKAVTVRTTARSTPISNYAFDVTPARLVTGLITERGICPASEEGLLGLFPEMQ